MRISQVLSKEGNLAANNKKLPLSGIISEAHKLHKLYINKGSIIDEAVYFLCLHSENFF